MGKRIVALLACVSLAFGLAACRALPIKTTEPTAVTTIPPTTTPEPTPMVVGDTPTPKPVPIPEDIPTPYPDETEQPKISEGPADTDEPEPVPVYDIPDIKNAGLTNDQFHKINLMLVGISGSRLYQKPIASLTLEDCLIFSFYVLNDLYGANHLPIKIFEDPNSDASIDPSDMKLLIESAFGNKFDTACKTTSESEVQLIDNRYYFYLMEGDPRNRPFVYHIEKIGKGTWKLRFDVVGIHYQYSIYRDKVEAVIKENTTSVYGYTLLSWKVLGSKSKLFDKAEASSTHTKIDGMTFHPRNVLDGKKSTFWLSTPQEESWLKVTFNKLTTVTGFNLDMDYIDEYYSEKLSVSPSSAIVELSDGTKIHYEDFSFAPGFQSFGREAKIKWIKIIFPAEISETGQPMKAGRYVIDVYAY